MLNAHRPQVEWFCDFFCELGSFRLAAMAHLPCALRLQSPCVSPQGKWYITAGQNELFDQFDCQVHFFDAPKPGKSALPCPASTLHA